nr:hypothetical protein [Pseudomonadota bacterium]
MRVSKRPPTSAVTTASIRAANTKVYNFGDIHGTGHYGFGVFGAAKVYNFGTSAYIRGNVGVGAATAVNDGTIDGASIGVIANRANNTAFSALIYGARYGVQINSGGDAYNSGTIASGEGATAGYGVYLADGGGVSNGGTIQGAVGVRAIGAAASAINSDQILGVRPGSESIYLGDGGAVTNTEGRVQGSSGVVAKGAAATVTNYGQIFGASGRADYGVYLGDGGRVTNGSTLNTAAYIYGGYGIVARNAPATVTNYGRIVSSYSNALGGIELLQGGLVTNGATGYTGALIVASSTAVYVGRAAAGAIDNFGTIISRLGDGVDLFAGGTVTNGSSGDTGAAIRSQYDGVYGYGPITTAHAATVINYGTISSSASAGVYLQYAGPQQNIITNGSAGDTGALIQGATDGVFSQSGSVNNFGIIQGAIVGGGAADSGAAGVGVELGAGQVTNGSAGDATAMIEGSVGVRIDGQYGTVTNFGTVLGTGGTALMLGDATDTLAVEAGSAFVGAVLGAGGSLDLDNGTGTLTGNLAGGTVTVSGSMTPTAFNTFNTVQIGMAATFSTSGTVNLGAGQRLIDLGILTLGAIKGRVVNDGVIEALGGVVSVLGAVSGRGQVTIGAALFACMGSFNQNVTFVGKPGVSKSILELTDSQAYRKKISDFSQTGGTFLDLADIAFTGSGEATYSGGKKGGVLTVTDGTHIAKIALVGDYLTSIFVAADDGHGGTIVTDTAKAAAVPPPAPSLSAPPHR